MKLYLATVDEVRHRCHYLIVFLSVLTDALHEIKKRNLFMCLFHFERLHNY